MMNWGRQRYRQLKALADFDAEKSLGGDADSAAIASDGVVGHRSDCLGSG
jgi:hypothetical protein